MNDLPLDPDIAVRRSARVLGAIALGGMIGATARYKVSTVIHVAPGTFPWATFFANVTGSFVLGFVLVRRFARAFVATGIIGAYTTFSTFSVETDLLVKDGHVGIAVAYVGASVVAGLGAVTVGVLAARKLGPA